MINALIQRLCLIISACLHNALYITIIMFPCLYHEIYVMLQCRILYMTQICVWYCAASNIIISMNLHVVLLKLFVMVIWLIHVMNSPKFFSAASLLLGWGYLGNLEKKWVNRQTDTKPQQQQKRTKTTQVHILWDEPYLKSTNQAT